jgi:hypothetical protein
MERGLFIDNLLRLRNLPKPFAVQTVKRSINDALDFMG